MWDSRGRKMSVHLWNLFLEVSQLTNRYALEGHLWWQYHCSLEYHLNSCLVHTVRKRLADRKVAQLCSLLWSQHDHTNVPKKTLISSSLTLLPLDVGSNSMWGQTRHPEVRRKVDLKMILEIRISPFVWSSTATTQRLISQVCEERPRDILRKPRHVCRSKML